MVSFFFFSISFLCIFCAVRTAISSSLLLFPPFYPIRYSTGRANIGRVQMDMGNTKEALTSFSRGLEIDPANILLRENIENLKLKTGDAVGTDGLKPPNDRDKRLAKKRSKAGVEQMRSGEFKKAFISFSDSLELDPTSSETWCDYNFTSRNVDLFLIVLLSSGLISGKFKMKWEISMTRRNHSSMG